jgi:hypothetical protein
MQKLRGGQQLSIDQLHPAGRLTVLKMVSKGWLEGPLAGGTYRLTDTGALALRAIIPEKRRTAPKA